MSKERIKAIGYCRAATREQSKQSFSIDAQKCQIAEAATRLNIEIVDWFEQVGHGSDKGGKVAAQRALDFCRENRGISYLMMTEPSRLHRTLSEFRRWAICFDGEDVALKFVAGSNSDLFGGMVNMMTTELMRKERSLCMKRRLEREKAEAKF